MQKHAALRATIGHDIAENEPQQDVESRTKEGGTRLYFLSVTAALPLDEIGIFWMTSAAFWTLHVFGEQVAKQIKNMYERIFDVDIAFVTQQLTRGEQVLPFNAVSNINSIFHTNMATWILFWCQKRLVASAIGKHTDEKGKEACYFDTYTP